MTPSIAVIVPVYNGSSHLAETLESVLAQTVPASEIIVIEDGSPAPSQEIVNRYPSVRYIERANAGVSSSRNFGASIATTEWLCFLDQDDLLLPEHLEQTSAALAQNASIDFTYCARQTLQYKSNGWSLTPAKEPPAVDQLGSILLQHCPFPPSGTCIRKQTFLESGGFLSRFDLAEDWELWVRLAAQGRAFHRCSQPTMAYRVHGESVSHQRPLPILAANIRVIRERIVPMLPAWKRLWVQSSMISRQQAEAAIILRQSGNSGGLTLLLRSLLRFPFGDLRRVKIALHMLLSGYAWTAWRHRNPQSAI